MISNRLEPYTEERPWGNFVKFTKGQPSTVKILTVKPKEAFSLQSHLKRDEFWHVRIGEGIATIGDKSIEAHTGSDFFIPRGTKHRLEGGVNGISVLEISQGEFDEGDITRFEDKYGRIKS